MIHRSLNPSVPSASLLHISPTFSHCARPLFPLRAAPPWTCLASPSGTSTTSWRCPCTAPHCLHLSFAAALVPNAYAHVAHGRAHTLPAPRSRRLLPPLGRAARGVSAAPLARGAAAGGAQHTVALPSFALHLLVLSNYSRRQSPGSLCPAVVAAAVAACFTSVDADAGADSGRLCGDLPPLVARVGPSPPLPPSSLLPSTLVVLYWLLSFFCRCPLPPTPSLFYLTPPLPPCRWRCSRLCCH